MNGYVQNLTNVYKYAFKRHVAPNQKIPLEELYKDYGVKHGIDEGFEFAEWVRNVKVRDPKTWAVVFEDVNLIADSGGVKPKAKSTEKEEAKVEIEGEVLQVSDQPIELPKTKSKRTPRKRSQSFTQTPVQRREPITDDDILNFPIGPTTKKELERVKDPKALKYALNKAKHMPGKAVLIKLIKDRLNELQYQF